MQQHRRMVDQHHPETAPAAERLKALFKELLDEHWGEGLRGAEPVGKWMGHPAGITTSIGTLAERHTVWVGEAARLVSLGTVEALRSRRAQKHLPSEPTRFGEAPPTPGR